MLYTREHLEKLEEHSLAPYALRSRESRGRVYPDHEPAYRTAFQRDRDRIIHTPLSAAWSTRPRSLSSRKATTIAPA